MNRTIEWLKVILLGVIAALLVMAHFRDDPQPDKNALRYSMDYIREPGEITFVITDRQTGVVKLIPCGGETICTVSFEQSNSN